MGNSESETLRQHRRLKRKYIRFLTKQQIEFAKEDLLSNEGGRRMSVSSEAVDDDLNEHIDWKLVLEAYLESKKEAYFWAREMLEYIKPMAK